LYIVKKDAHTELHVRIAPMIFKRWYVIQTGDTPKGLIS
jgi:hypothetical protein